MIDSILTLLTAIIFFFIGRFSVVENKEILQTVKAITKHRIEPGVSKILSPKERKKKNSIQAEVDKEMSELLGKLTQK